MLMDYAAFIMEVVSAIVCAILVWFMIKPYRVTGENRYLGLPLGFAFLSMSYVLLASTFYFESFRFLGEVTWLQLFTQTYAYSFLAATYFFSNKPSKYSRLWWNLTYAMIALVAVISYLVIIEPLIFSLGLPSYDKANQYLLVFNIVCLAYISIHTLRSHALKPDPKTIWIPLSYLLIGFGQYSLLIWAIDSSLTAYFGAQFLRLAGLLVLLFVSYQTFYSAQELHKEGSNYEEDSP